MLKIISNRDKVLAEEAEKQLKEIKNKYGKRYCPCSLDRNNDTICPCLSFREMDKEGECYCGRYEKIYVN